MSDSHLYGEDLIFADQLLERLYEFTKREATHPEDAMVLECVDGRHRYIVHQVSFAAKIHFDKKYFSIFSIFGIFWNFFQYCDVPFFRGFWSAAIPSLLS